MELDLDVDFDFAAAHQLPLYDGPCKRMHGHNYRLRVSIRGEPDARTGMLMDFEHIRRIVTEGVVGVVDHQVLNDFIENPTAENVIQWAWSRLDGKLQGLRELRLWETPAYSVAFRGARS
ncbi:MAG: 6-carboxytetrahydropterin synthase QueD [Deltaproteobacteria bacterium]|nr:6-carboxytetrahydropterin synthase QueD [Deltaproteobacteria bacterium]